MRRHEAIARLKQVEPAIRALGAASLYLFGSHARDEARPDSDVDVFIDKEPSHHFGLHEFMGIYLTLREVLGVEVDIRRAKGWWSSIAQTSSARPSGCFDGTKRESACPA
jgi:uncharacterized protein